MNPLRELYNRLTLRQIILLTAAGAAVFGGVYWFSRWSAERDFRPLFTGLAAEDAGGVTAKLKELNVEYRLKDDGSVISIHSDRIAEVRLQLAVEGLPHSGRIGFELFDKTNFGASEFTEQVNYQRAVEGELERSVMTIREVDNARVHITPAKDSLYLESRQSAKASVLVKLKRGAKLEQQNVAAISQLAASAVPGLNADQVSVMDTNGNLLNRPKARADGGESSEAALEYRKGIEKEIQNKIAATLEPLLGAEHFRVGVSADVDLTSGEVSEETYDPAKIAMVSSQKTEDGPVGSIATAGVPGTASNIPNPTAQNSTGASTTNYSRKTENVNYQNSRVVTHTKIPQGALRRLSLSILVDHSLHWEGAKRVIEAPSADKLMVIREVVAAATGLNMERGDLLVVDAFPFEATLSAEPLNAAPQVSGPPLPPGMKLPPWLEKLMAQKNFLLIAAIGGAALMALLIGGMVFWRRSSKKKTAARMAAGLEGSKSRQLDVGEQLGAKLAEHAESKVRKDNEALLALKMPDITTKKTDVLKKHIAAEIAKNPENMAHVVRSWLNGEYQR